MYELDLDKDWPQVANIAASSLPEEENGTWKDVALCTLRNMAIVGAGLTAIGSLPGQADAMLPTTQMLAELQGLYGSRLPYDPAADPAVQELQRSLDFVGFFIWRSTRPPSNPDFVIYEYEEDDDRRRW